MDKEQLIDDLVTFMSLAAPASDSPLPLSYFDEAESIDSHVSEAGDTIAFLVPSGTVRSQSPMLTFRPDLVREHIDVSFVESRDLLGPAGFDSVKYGVSRIREVPRAFLKGKKTAKGHPARAFSRTFAVSIGDINHDGSFFGGCIDYVGWSCGGWQSSENYKRTSVDDQSMWDRVWRAASSGVASMLLRRFFWRVSLRLDDGPSVSFSTDPEGVRALARMRDIPPGKQRRTALVHWVREHWRKKRDPSASDLSSVREHLRGASEFTWNGLRGRIVPSVSDQERAVQ